MNEMQRQHFDVRMAEIQAQLAQDAADAPDRPSAAKRRNRWLARKSALNREKGYRMLRRGRSQESINDLGDFAS
jgi:hypothetical protein